MYDRWVENRVLPDFDNMNLPRSSTELITASDETLNFWLAKFIYETRKIDGSRFPWKTVSKKQADVISVDDEEKLWTCGGLGGDNPQQLVDTILFLNGLHFALRSGVEHRNLMVDQIEQIEPNENCEDYVLIHR